MAVGLSQRNHQAELMDEPGLDPAVHLHALRGLQRINSLTRSSAIVWSPLQMLARESPTKTLRVLDIASGGGDVARFLARRSKLSRLNVQIDGVDISATAVEHATQNATKAGLHNLAFRQLDAIHDPLPEDYDVLMCSLFLHHLTRDDAVTLLSKMRKATRCLVLISDLQRSRLGYLLAWWGSRLLSRSRIVHVDGPRSVEAAFTCEEALAMAQEAGLQGAMIERHWPERFLLRWRKP